jgi:hypothetical protein
LRVGGGGAPWDCSSGESAARRRVCGGGRPLGGERDPGGLYARQSGERGLRLIANGGVGGGVRGADVERASGPALGQRQALDAPAFDQAAAGGGVGDAVQRGARGLRVSGGRR